MSQRNSVIVLQGPVFHSCMLKFCGVPWALVLVVGAVLSLIFYGLERERGAGQDRES